MQFLTKALTDFGFERFITSMIIKIIYALVFIVTVLGYVIGLIATTNQYGGAGFFGWLIVGSPAMLIGLCIWRVWLECLILFFRMYEDVHMLAGRANGVSSLATGMRVEQP
jgi:Domain of unknown function (DUF4282)